MSKQVSGHARRWRRLWTEGALGAAVLAVGLSCLSGGGVLAEQNGNGQGANAQAIGAGEPSVPNTEAVRTARQLGEAFSTVAEHASRSVVSIRVEQRQQLPQMPGAFRFFQFGPFGGAPFGQAPQGPRGEQGPQGEEPDRFSIRRGAGSGVIIRPDGYILTNNHVVQDASHIEVVLHNERRYEGQVVGTDPATDLAVVKIDASGLPTGSFADSDEVRVGEWVLAIGSPFGLDYTTTVGVISATGRGGIGMNEIEDYVQTDASINPGNSGGPLVTLSGRVVGINTMIAGRGTGIGFAVPSNMARVVADQLIDKGKVERAWIGVAFQELSPRLARQLGLESHHGALVSDVVEGGPAAKAGVQPRDVIVSVDGQPVREGRDLLRRVLAKGVGDEVEIGVIRNGERRKLELTTGQRPVQGETAAPSSQGGGPASAELGLQLQPLTPPLAQRLGLEPDAQGAVVTDVTAGSPAQRAGLRQGDVVVEADQAQVDDPSDVEQALADGSALLRIRRGDGALFLVLEK